MEIRTAQEIHAAIEWGPEIEREFLTDPSSEWVRKVGVDGALYMRDALLLEVEEAIGVLYFPLIGGPLRDAAIRLQDRIRKHLREAGLQARKEKP